MACSYDGLRIIDISNPADLSEIGHSNTPGPAMSVAVSGGYAYVANWNAGLIVIDISDPVNPVEAGNFSREGSIRSVSLSADAAYLADERAGLIAIDINDPANPVETGFYDTPDISYGIAVSGNYAYIANYQDGLRVIDISDPANPAEAGICDTPGIAYHVDLCGSYAYVADWWGGLRIIDISDPANPVETGFYQASGVNDVLVSGNFAYLPAIARLLILDISEPANPVETTFLETPGEARGVALSGGYALVADYNEGVRIIDISDPANPFEAGSYSTLTGVYDVAAAGDYAYAASEYEGFWIIDISDPANPVAVGNIDTGGAACGIYLSDTYAYLTDGVGLKVIDITDPSNPTVKGFYDTSSIAIGVTVSDPYCYLVDHNDGLYILEFEEESAVLFTSLSARPLGRAIELKWSVEEGGELEGFRILRCLPGEQPALLSGVLLERSARRYIDSSVENGKRYHYTVEALTSGGAVIASVEVSAETAPPVMKLYSNFPNPFNPSTTIAFSLPERERIRLEVFDINGKKIRTLVHGIVEEGYREIIWNGRDDSGSEVVSGLYFYRLKAGKKMISRKAVLLR